MPFEMDDEFVRHALGALTVPETLLKSASAASKRVDIRTLKKKKRAKEAERTRIRNMSGRQLVDHLFDKFVKDKDGDAGGEEGEDGVEEEEQTALSSPASEEDVKPTEEELKAESDVKVEDVEMKPDTDVVAGAEEVHKEEVESDEKVSVDPVQSADETQPAAHDVSKAVEESKKSEEASDKTVEKSEEKAEEKDESKETPEKETEALESDVEPKDAPTEDKEPETSQETGKQPETVNDQEQPATEEKDQAEKASGSKETTTATATTEKGSGPEEPVAREEETKVAAAPFKPKKGSVVLPRRPGFSHPDIERTAIITEEFKRKREEIRNTQELAGEECDAMECFCREPEDSKEAVDASAAVSESQGCY